MNVKNYYFAQNRVDNNVSFDTLADVLCWANLEIYPTLAHRSVWGKLSQWLWGKSSHMTTCPNTHKHIEHAQKNIEMYFWKLGLHHPTSEIDPFRTLTCQAPAPTLPCLACPVVLLLSPAHPYPAMLLVTAGYQLQRTSGHISWPPKTSQQRKKTTQINNSYWHAREAATRKRKE